MEKTEPRLIKNDYMEDEPYPTWDDEFESFDPELDLVETTPEGWYAKYMRMSQGLTKEESDKLCAAIIEAERRQVSLREILKGVKKCLYVL